MKVRWILLIVALFFLSSGIRYSDSTTTEFPIDAFVIFKPEMIDNGYYYKKLCLELGYADILNEYYSLSRYNKLKEISDIFLSELNKIHFNSSNPCKYKVEIVPEYGIQHHAYIYIKWQCMYPPGDDNMECSPAFRRFDEWRRVILLIIPEIEFEYCFSSFESEFEDDQPILKSINSTDDSIRNGMLTSDIMDIDVDSFSKTVNIYVLDKPLSEENETSHSKYIQEIINYYQLNYNELCIDGEIHIVFKPVFNEYNRLEVKKFVDSVSEIINHSSYESFSIVNYSAAFNRNYKIVSNIIRRATETGNIIFVMSANADYNDPESVFVPDCYYSNKYILCVSGCELGCNGYEHIYFAGNHEAVDFADFTFTMNCNKRGVSFAVPRVSIAAALLKAGNWDSINASNMEEKLSKYCDPVYGFAYNILGKVDFDKLQNHD